MSNPNLYQTFTAEAYNYKKLIPLAVTYITQNSECVCREDIVSMLLSSKTLFESPITNLYNRMVLEEVMDLWTFIRPLTRTTGGLPTALTLKQIPLDLEQAKSVVDHNVEEIIHSELYLKNKIILNIVPFTRVSGQLVDATEFYSHIVRDGLCRSYYNSSRSSWVTPAFCQYLTKVYTMILGGSVSQWYRLDMKNSRLISYLFALFFMSQMVPPAIAIEMLRTGWKNMAIPEPAEQAQVLGLVKEMCPEFHTEGMQNISSMFTTINKGLNIPRVTVDRSLLCNKLRGALSSDVVYTSLAISYPPIFAYLVLRALSGVPSGLSVKMKTMGLLSTKDRELVSNELVRSRSFIDSLQDRS